MQKDKKSEKHLKDPHLSVLSHQLKAPLTSILSLLRTLTQGFTGELNPKALYFIEKAEKRAQDAQQLITDLLDYQRYSDDQGGLACQEEIDIIHLLEDLVSRNRAFAASCKISIRVDLPQGISPILAGDQRALINAFRNLLENAIKYSVENSTVTLKLILPPEGKKWPCPEEE